MISDKDLFLIGHTVRPFGIRGDIVVQFDDFEYQEIDVEFYFLRLDGIPVPFYIEESVPLRDGSAKVKFEDISDETAASEYSGLDVLVEKRHIENLETYVTIVWEYFVGFEVVESGGETLGKIVDVDDSTINVLFIVSNGDGEIFIPATDDYVDSIDEEKKIMYLNLPEGFTEIQP